MDYIDGNRFRRIGNERIDENIVFMYADTHDLKVAITNIENQKDKQFILITHNSDDPITETYIPENLLRWFGTNVEFKHPKITPIPIGLENEHWHPQKRSILKIYKNKIASSNNERKIKAFSQFNQATFPIERSQILRNINSGLIYSDYFRGINGQDFYLYCNNLIQYAFCICPRGNGVDTHRIWESLYLGCIPIVKRHHTHTFEEDLPILFIDNWTDITQDFLQEKINTIDYSLFNSPLLTMTYWEEKIKNEKNKY